MTLDVHLKFDTGMGRIGFVCSEDNFDIAVSEAEVLGMEVMLLKRIAEGEVKLGHLQPGEYRPLSEKEKEALLNGVGIPYVRKVKTSSAQKSATAAAYRNRRQRSISDHERRFKKQFLK